jgi:subtilisin family serine protease
VAAVDSLMNRANFSQYNADVELAAPGVGVLSTVPPDGYEAWSGTSMATPHVAAVAALIWSANPSWGVDQVRQALTATALDRGAVGRDVYYGYGIVQAAAALAYLGGGTPPPATPTPTAVPTATPLPTATPTPPGGELSVTVTTDRASYTNGKTVYITVTVTDQESGAVSGAAVTVVITGANGSKVTLSGTTGTAGTVTVKWRVSTKKLGTGEYSVSATATKAGYTPGTGTTTFTVQ